MSIFDENITNCDELVEQRYNIESDWIRNKRIIRALIPKESPSTTEKLKSAYYHPEYLFWNIYATAIHKANNNIKEPKTNKERNLLRGGISLEKIDMTNLRKRFAKLVGECEMLIYKEQFYFKTGPSTIIAKENDLFSRATEMMYDYITKETRYSKYFCK